MPGNKDAEKIYMLVRDQLIIGGLGTVVALNQMVIHAAIDRLGVDDGAGCFEKVVMVYRAVLNHDNERKGSK